MQTPRNCAFFLKKLLASRIIGSRIWPGSGVCGGQALTFPNSQSILLVPAPSTEKCLCRHLPSPWHVAISTPRKESWSKGFESRESDDFSNQFTPFDSFCLLLGDFHFWDWCGFVQRLEAKTSFLPVLVVASAFKTYRMCSMSVSVTYKTTPAESFCCSDSHCNLFKQSFVCFTALTAPTTLSGRNSHAHVRRTYSSFREEDTPWMRWRWQPNVLSHIYKS